MMKIKIIFTLLLVAALLIGFRFSSSRLLAPETPKKSLAVLDQPSFDRKEAKIIDFAAQPNTLYRSESLFHDRILERQLAAYEWRLREHRFRSGNEILPYADGRIQVMVLGDIPSLIAMSRNRIGIFAVCRQGYNTIVAKRRMTPAELKGMRIGCPPGTTAHFTLDRILTAVGLTLRDIVLIPMQPDEMLSAMKNKRVDAVVSQEPVTSGILAVSGTAAIAVTEGFSYLAFDLDFCKRYPHLQKAILAAVIRATRWVRLDEKKIRMHLMWDRDAALDFTGSSPVEVNGKWIELLRRETIDNPSFPLLPLDFCQTDGLPHQQFEFLKKNGFIPRDAVWETVCKRADIELLPAIIRDGKRWKIDLFDYSSEKLYLNK